jgi:hypothetical protein
MFPLSIEGLEFGMLVLECRHYRVCGVEVKSFEVLVGSGFILRQRLLPQGIEASYRRTIHRVRRIICAFKIGKFLIANIDESETSGRKGHALIAPPAVIQSSMIIISPFHHGMRNASVGKASSVETRR